MLESITTVIVSGLVGAVVAAIVNHVQGDDVVKCAKGGLAGGIATALLALVSVKV